MIIDFYTYDLLLTQYITLSPLYCSNVVYQRKMETRSTILVLSAVMLETAAKYRKVSVSSIIVATYMTPVTAT